MSKLNIILLHDIKDRGRLGDEISVRGGYARNYLFKRGFAIAATKSNRAHFQLKRQEAEERSSRLKDEAEDYQARLKSVNLKIYRKAGDDKKIFGSVKPADLSALLAEQGINIPKSFISFKEPVRYLGNHLAFLNLHNTKTAELRIEVLQEGKYDQERSLESVPQDSELGRFEGEGGNSNPEEEFEGDEWGSGSSMEDEGWGNNNR